MVIGQGKIIDFTFQNIILEHCNGATYSWEVNSLCFLILKNNRAKVTSTRLKIKVF